MILYFRFFSVIFIKISYNAIPAAFVFKEYDSKKQFPWNNSAFLEVFHENVKVSTQAGKAGKKGLFQEFDWKSWKRARTVAQGSN